MTDHSMKRALPPLFAALAILVTACAGEVRQPPPGDTPAPKVIYGEDDRLDVYAHPDPFWRDLALESAVAFFDARDIDESDPDDIGVRGRTLRQNMGVCVNEPFASQPAGAFCSGVLIGRDIVLTAGHCVSDPFDCSRLRLVFGYHKEAPGTLATVTAQDVHRCDEVLAWREESGGLDFAILRLDRDAGAERVPATLRREDTLLAPGTEVGMIGFPSGLPMKLAIGGVVTRNGPGGARFFEATVDAYGGNSGSGIYDREGVLLGLLARGATDFVRDGACLRSNVLPETGPGQSAEGIPYLARAVEAMCADHDHEICGDIDFDPTHDATADAPAWGERGSGGDDWLCAAGQGPAGAWWWALPGLLLARLRRREA